MKMQDVEVAWPAYWCLTWIKLNSRQLSALWMDGMEVTANRERSPRAMMPKETYISTLQTSSSFHEFSILACTYRERKYYIYLNDFIKCILICFIYILYIAIFLFIFFKYIIKVYNAYWRFILHTQTNFKYTFIYDIVIIGFGAWQI